MKAIWLLLGLCLIGCKKQLPLATLPPVPAQVAPTVPHDEKLPEPPAPQTSSVVVAPQPNIAPQPVGTIPPPAPPAPPKKKLPPRKPVPPVPAPKVEAAPPEVAKLRQVLTPVQEQSYNQIIDQDLQRARTNLAIAAGKTLSDPQKTVVQQVRSFIKQVEDLRKTDLEEAKGLSHKADILASDLARSFQ